MHTAHFTIVTLLLPVVLLSISVCTGIGFLKWVLREAYKIFQQHQGKLAAADILALIGAILFFSSFVSMPILLVADSAGAIKSFREGRLINHAIEACFDWGLFLVFASLFVALYETRSKR